MVSIPFPQPWRLLVALISILITASPVGAAEIECLDELKVVAATDAELAQRIWPSGFRPAPGMCSRGVIRGRIKSGDFEKVKDLYNKSHRWLWSFTLISTGGDAHEAIKIGKLLRKYLLAAHAPIANIVAEGSGSGFRLLCKGPECVCASACALIWFGAVHRSGDVGLHRPQFNDPELKDLPADQASNVYKRALQDILHYLEEMEAPQPLTDAMISTSSSDVQWVNSLQDRLEHPPSFTEWVDASCGSFTADDQKLWRDLAFSEPQKLFDHEAKLFKLLGDKQRKRGACESRLIYNHRDQLPPPAGETSRASSAEPFTDLKQTPSRDSHNELFPSDDGLLYVALGISFFATWGIGLAPAIIARYAVYNRPLTKKAANLVAGIFCFSFAVFFLILNDGLGVKSNPGPGNPAIWVIVFFVSRWILVSEPNTASVPVRYEPHF